MVDEPPSNPLSQADRAIARPLFDEITWLVVGTPAEGANTVEMNSEQLATLYPDGPKTLPPELSSP
jgi:hypothetical protein